MRKSSQTVTEIEEAEKAADTRTQTRATGFSLMSIRDRGWARLRDYNHGKEVYMRWNVGDNKFVLDNKTDGKEIVLDAEELRKYLRWV